MYVPIKTATATISIFHEVCFNSDIRFTTDIPAYVSIGVVMASRSTELIDLIINDENGIPGRQKIIEKIDTHPRIGNLFNPGTFFSIIEIKSPIIEINHNAASPYTVYLFKTNLGFG